MELDKMYGEVLKRLPQGQAGLSRDRVQAFDRERVLLTENFGRINFDEGKLWAVRGDRSLGRYVHGLIFLADWPESIIADESGRLAELAFSTIRLWHEKNADPDDRHEMAFHDETTAQRMINILAIYVSSANALDLSEILWLQYILDETADLLASSDFHSTGNNHGMFQDLALINYSILADWRETSSRESYFNIGESRIKAYFLDAFTSEGVHKENTPTYHLMVCWQLKKHSDLLKAIDHPDFSVLTELLENAEEYATHCIMPNGKYPPISDTKQKNLAWNATRIFEDKYFDFAATAGELGEKPPERIKIFEESGYATYRSSWGDPNATYLLFQAAYNANYHKHSDDLSLYLMHNGIELITEAGPYGYNYKDPLTTYAYSQFAHNNIVVNGRSVRRTDGLADTVSLQLVEKTENGFSVVGQTGRLAGAVHERQVLVNEVDGIPMFDVVDTVWCPDGISRSFEMNWNLGPETTPFVHGQGFELHHKDSKVMDAHMTADVATSLRISKGLSKPKEMGWRFPVMGVAEPNNVITVKFEGSKARLVTRIRLDSFSYNDRGLVHSSDPWKRFQSTVGLNYLFIPAKSIAGAKSLVVVFSAVGALGDFTYNYKASLDSIDANVLYILDDFGDQGAYYLMDHGDRGIFFSVQNLIKKTLIDLGIDSSRLVTLGSSKGGTAAIIHGISANAARVFVGAPQTKIGTFVSVPHPNILEFMTGSKDESAVLKLDALLFDMVEQASQLPRIDILVGDADHHYAGHVMPFVHHIRSLNEKIGLEVLPGVPHGDIGRQYRLRLVSFLESFLGDSSDKETSYSFDLSFGKLDVIIVGRDIEACIIGDAGYQYAFTLFDQGGMNHKIGYTHHGSARWSDMVSDRYRIRVYRRNSSDSSDLKAASGDWFQIW